MMMIDGQRITLANMDEALAAIAQDAARAESFAVFTLNLDHLVKRRQMADFRAAYRRARHVTADGWPVVWLARRQGMKVSRTTGADMIVPLCQVAAALELPVAFVGSTQDVIFAATARLRELAPGLKIAGRWSPPFGFSPYGAAAGLLIEDIRKSGARLCFVALGAPKQELFAARAVEAGVPCGFPCIGAAVDFIAGAQRRAPRWVQSAGLEWAWRLAGNPRRLAGRYARSAIIFAKVAYEQMTDRAAMGGHE